MLNRLNEAMREFADSFTDINSGGCCVMAAIIAQHINHVVDDLRIRVVSWYGGSSSLDEIREHVVDPMNKLLWNAQGCKFSHVWVEFTYDGERYAIDTDSGVLPVQEFYSSWGTPMDGCFTIEEACSFADDADGWNRCFDRDQIPDMVRLADELLDFSEEVMYG